ncbi:MAG: ribonuclease PH [Magnetococcales bacterium]|nr:ribonuclease PH [Magnetococcales bacterium]
MPRPGNRAPDALRPVTLSRRYLRYAEGSCLIECGGTHVLCAVSVEERQPPWMRGKEGGWITAEYGMLPRATKERKPRESTRGKQEGRTQEIQRLVGRALRSVVKLSLLGERTLWVDCDVIQADGGTRCAAITGSFVALYDACRALMDKGVLKTWPIQDHVAAVSCGLLNDQPLLDLEYEEDYACAVDMNFVMTGSGRFVEIQGTAEKEPFDRASFDAMAALGESGIRQLIGLQRDVLGLG